MKQGIILEGINPDELTDKIRAMIREELAGIRQDRDKTESEYIEVNEACRKYHVSRSTVHRWLAKGIIDDSHKIGGRRLLLVSDIEKAMQ